MTNCNFSRPITTIVIPSNVGTFNDLYLEVTEEDFEKELYTAGLPDIDLIVRTSGEQRLSNFFPYQSVYAELYFTNAYWPDFNEEELEKALTWYSERNRRFGGV